MGKCLWIRQENKSFIIVVKHGPEELESTEQQRFSANQILSHILQLCYLAGCYHLGILVFPLFIFRPSDNPFFLSEETILFFKGSTMVTHLATWQSLDMN